MAKNSHAATVWASDPAELETDWSGDSDYVWLKVNGSVMFFGDWRKVHDLLSAGLARIEDEAEHRVHEPVKAKAEEAIAKAEGRLAGTVTDAECDEARRALWRARDAADDDAASPWQARLDGLVRLLDAHEKAMSEEGCLHEMGRELPPDVLTWAEFAGSQWGGA